MREKMGLDQPFIVQYGKWLANMSTLDAGVSLRTGEPVAEMVKRRFFMTFQLAIVSITLMFSFSFVLGLVATLKENKLTDYIIRVLSFGAISMPDFWLGLMLILYFVVHFHWFKLTDPYAPESVILPACTLAIPLIGRYTRQIQSVIGEEMTKEYVVGARARVQGVEDCPVSCAAWSAWWPDHFIWAFLCAAAWRYRYCGINLFLARAWQHGHRIHNPS